MKPNTRDKIEILAACASFGLVVAGVYGKNGYAVAIGLVGLLRGLLALGK